MAQVNVSISGKTYRMACDDGQEDYLVGLADQLNAAIEQLRARFGEIGDQRLTVMAAITLADRSAEAERKLGTATAEAADAEDAHAALVERQTATEASLTQTLDAIADRVEALAARVAGAGEGEE